jgi:hypothetical protein
MSRGLGRLQRYLFQTLKQWERWKPRIATKRGQRKLTRDRFLQALYRWFSHSSAEEIAEFLAQ